MQAGIPYTVATGEKLVNETFGPNNIRRRASGTEQFFPMDITDGRKAVQTLSLDETASSSSSTRPQSKTFLMRGS